MARASIPTWLSLDQWAQILGINPLHFNGMFHSLMGTPCNAVYKQYSWQDPNRVGREDIAQAIHDAEQEIANFVGYNLIPDWIAGERQQTVAPANRELFSAGIDARGLPKTIVTNRGHFISGGSRALSLVQADALIVYSDADSDTYLETATVTVATQLDPCELFVFFPASVIGASNAGLQEYEIRPVRRVVSGGNVQFIFRREQVGLFAPTQGLAPADVDAADINNFFSVVDVYRVYTLPAIQLTMLWHAPQCGSCGGSGCAACTLSSQTGCLTARDNRLGLVAYTPAEWNVATSVFDESAYVEMREPDSLQLSYYSGWKDIRLGCANTQMDLYWARAVTYYSLSLLDRVLCECNNVRKSFDYWREDLAKASPSGSFQNIPTTLGTPFGTTRGGLYAYHRCMADGRRLYK